MKKPRRIPPGTRIPIPLSRRDRELILERLCIGGDVERRVRIARMTVSGLGICG